MRTYRSRVIFSDSLAKAKLSSPEHTLTSRLPAKKPESAIPISRKFFGVNRPLGLGFNNFLYKGNMAFGMFPRAAAVGGGCGGVAVDGG